MESSAGRAEDRRYGGEWLVRISRFLESGWSLTFTLHYRKNYVCVEPGYVRGFVSLEPQTTWIGQQVISVVKEHPNL